ncbi:alpha-glucuronidase [Pilibacter termitis]|uniref:Alpha-glucuronidase n=1 Tax=Pilibacter termitis TaxID=263852 RepID=A0A1T4R343_9ENTE|nr:alpha-glucuronidase [Pilibacter termitis]SKA10038.1 alpha-glucuronidase [Pilibacter termitis]
MTRDKCWLKKKIANPAFTGYFIEKTDVISEVIVQEMDNLFLDCPLVEKGKAYLTFELVNHLVLGEEGFVLEKNSSTLTLSSNTTKGLLYGLFQLYMAEITGKNLGEKFTSVPDQAIRMINHWDNFDDSNFHGTIERGYAGDSVFYLPEGEFRRDEQLLLEYARLLSSIGINAISINNVNVHKKEAFFITDKHLKDVKQINDIFAKYGIKTFLSINFASPKIVGGLETADPLDNEVIAFWEGIVQNIYQQIPDFGGFLIKADAEGEPGPFAYGRNHDDGANMLARTLKKFEGILIWRCFVYNHLQDWRDRTTDRAKAQYDNFAKLDGKFDDNVILQIKNGPIDFNVREPISPLFGALRATNQMLELQITQEYTGQQKHICYLVPSWRRILDFDTKYEVEQSQIKDIFKNQSPNKRYSGIAAIGNVGMDSNWTGHKLAQANFYGYGRLIWNNYLSKEEVTEDWLRLSFDLSNEALEQLAEILLTSWETYEDYTAPLGLAPALVKPNHHYGPDIDGYEYSPWGCYHYADREGLGQFRTVAEGTGYTQQYSPALADYYENPATCPDETILFFRRMNYTDKLKSGKTVIQHIYDTHFRGYERVLEYQKTWLSLENEIDEKSFQNVATRLEEQVRCARDWRDEINTYFYRKSGIPDEQGRVIYA